jgi:hypothetical protein
MTYHNRFAFERWKLYSTVMKKKGKAITETGRGGP